MEEVHDQPPQGVESMGIDIAAQGFKIHKDLSSLYVGKSRPTAERTRDSIEKY